MTGYKDDGWQRMHNRNCLKQSVQCLIFVLQWWCNNLLEFSTVIMTLDSVVSPQVLNKYSILVDVKRRRFKYQSGREGDEAKRHRSHAKGRRVGIFVKLTLDAGCIPEWTRFP